MAKGPAVQAEAEGRRQERLNLTLAMPPLFSLWL